MKNPDIHVYVSFMKPCLLRFLCPGDGGDTTVMYMGHLYSGVSKDDPIVKFYGSLDAAMVYVNKAALLVGGKQRRVLRLLLFSLMHLGFYINTGQERHLDRAHELYCRALKETFSIIRDGVPGWVICESAECAAIDEARIWVRWAERRAIALNNMPLIKHLNLISNLLFELMRTTPHMVYVPTGPAQDTPDVALQESTYL